MRLEALSASAAVRARPIEVWVSERYRPFVDAGFNVTVLCGSLTVAVALLRWL